MNLKKMHLDTCEAQVHRQACGDAAAFTLFRSLGGTTRLLVLQPHVGGGEGRHSCTDAVPTRRASRPDSLGSGHAATLTIGL